MYTTEAATLADALDALGAGLFVVDATGRIVHANTSGRAMLQERRVLRSADGRLAACEARAAAALRELLLKAAGPDARPSAMLLSAGFGAIAGSILERSDETAAILAADAGRAALRACVGESLDSVVHVCSKPGNRRIALTLLREAPPLPADHQL